MHEQNNIERGFLVNRQILDDNLQEKCLISQRLMYDTIITVEKIRFKFDISKKRKLEFDELNDIKGKRKSIECCS